MGGNLPILSIRALPQKVSDEKIKSTLKKVCIKISEAYGCEQSQVWATWNEIQPGFYCEGSNSSDIQTDKSHPPICELVCFEGKSKDQIESVLKIAASTLSSGLEIPNNIFITYREAKSGEVIAGNGIVRRS